MRFMSKVISAGLIAATLVIVPTIPAAAASFSVSGVTYSNYTWTNHSKFRDKYTTSWANFTAGYIGCAGWIDLRLRTSSAIATYSSSWGTGTSKNFYGILGSHPEDGRLAPGSYAFSSLWGGCGTDYISWSGTLTW